MKIDMLSMGVNFTNCQDIKLGQGDKNFLELLNAEVGSSDIEEGLNLDLEKVENTEDELIALMASIINNLNLSHLKSDNSMDIKVLDQVVENAQAEEIISSENLSEIFSELFSETQSDEFFKNLNVNQGDVLSGLEELNVLDKDNKNNPFVELINKVYEGKLLKKDLAIEDRFNINAEDGDISLVNDSDNFMEYKKSINIIGMEKEDKLLQVESLKYRNIVVEEPMNSMDSELSLLNSIAFPSKTNSESVKENQPVLVRNEFLGSDVLKVVKYLNNNKIEELNVKMTPKDLGEINIKLLKSEDNNELIITLSNKKSFELIKENVSEIENHLVNMDLKIKQVIVQVKNEVQSDFSGSLNQQFNKNSSKEEKKNNFTNRNGVLEEEESIQGDDNSNINLLI